MLAMKGYFDLAELEHGLVRVEKLRSESSRSAPSHALAVAHVGSGQTGTGGGTHGRVKECVGSQRPCRCRGLRW